MVKRRELHSTLKQLARFSDTITLPSEENNEDNGRSCHGEKPRNISVMMILNEVEQMSMNGGVKKAGKLMKKQQPEFILLAENGKNCKKVITAFLKIFTSNPEKNNSDGYDLCWLKPDKPV